MLNIMFDLLSSKERYKKGSGRREVVRDVRIAIVEHCYCKFMS